MKVLSGHVVTKPQCEDSMDLLIMPVSAVQMNTGLPQLKQIYDNKLTNTSHTVTDNVSRKRWKSILVRVQRKHMDTDCSAQFQNKALFGQALTDVCEKNGNLPKPIMEILIVLLRKGPYTEGVFRKAGSARARKEIKEQLNNSMEVDLKNKPVILLADLLKDFLRNLPGSLLVEDRYQAWMTAIQNQDLDEIKLVIKTLPEPNIVLLKLLIVLLYHISANAERNKMDSNSLAICVSPNLLRTDNLERQNNVTKLTEFLIDNCSEIFGKDALTLLGDPKEEEVSDTNDSLSSLRHDSAYDSNDPDADGYKGSYAETHAFHSDTEEKTLNRFQVSSSHDAVGKHTSKPFIRRRSEPTIVFDKSARNQPALNRSHTEMDFYGHNLAKQISDECVMFGAGKSLLTAQKKIYTSGKHLQHASKNCSSSSLESTFSSSSDSSIQTSTPIIPAPSQKQAVQRKLSFPSHSKTHGTVHCEATKKRSQSMKAAHSRTKICFSRGGISKQAQKALRHSHTLPEVPDRTFLVSQKPRRVSSEEVFQLVDSRTLSNPPSYEQAIQDNTYIALSLCSPLTVDAARCLSRHTCSQSTFPTAEPSNSCSLKHSSCWGGERSDVSSASSTLPESKQGTVSETKSEECNNGLLQCCSRQLLENLDVRESYV